LFAGYFNYILTQQAAPAKSEKAGAQSLRTGFKPALKNV